MQRVARHDSNQIWDQTERNLLSTLTIIKASFIKNRTQHQSTNKKADKNKTIRKFSTVNSIYQERHYFSVSEVGNITSSCVPNLPRTFLFREKRQNLRAWQYAPKAEFIPAFGRFENNIQTINKEFWRHAKFVLVFYPCTNVLTNKTTEK